MKYRVVLETYDPPEGSSTPTIVEVYPIDAYDDELALLVGVFDEFRESVKILLEKRRDYGTANIKATGPTGISVRLVDKVHRLYHLLSTGKEPENESVQDTWTDIINYGLIGKMLRRGDW